MKTSLKLVLAAGLGLSGIGLTAASASAMPMSGLDPAIAKPADIATGVEKARWICGPYGGCRWVPGWRYWGPRYRYWRPYGYWGPRRWGPYGYYRGWRRPYYW